MSSYASSPQEGPFPALVKVVRRIQEARERRLQRDVQRRAEWIEEARNAPTEQDRMERRGR